MIIKAAHIPLSLRTYSIVLFSALLFISCKKSKTVTTTGPIKERTAGYLLKRYEKNEFDFEWMGMKIDAEVATLGETQGFKASIRMRRDSVIWISISPALGIEVFKVLITPDSVKYVSKIPDNKYYYIGGFDALSEMLKLDVDFDMLQDILIGNAVGLDKENGKFRSEIDEQQYLLISKYKRRVRRVVGIDDRKLNPDDTITVNPNDPRYQRNVRRSDENDLIVSRYWLEPDNYHLVKCIFNDLINQRTVQIDYSNFDNHDEQFYPKDCRLNVRHPQGEQTISFNIIRIATDKTYEFPFEIPDDCERRLKP